MCLLHIFLLLIGLFLDYFLKFLLPKKYEKWLNFLKIITVNNTHWMYTAVKNIPNYTNKINNSFFNIKIIIYILMMYDRFFINYHCHVDYQLWTLPVSFSNIWHIYTVLTYMTLYFFFNQILSKLQSKAIIRHFLNHKLKIQWYFCCGMKSYKIVPKPG